MEANQLSEKYEDLKLYKRAFTMRERNKLIKHIKFSEEKYRRYKKVAEDLNEKWINQKNRHEKKLMDQ